MANDNQIDLILRAVFKGEEEFKRAQLAVAMIVGATEKLGIEATKTGDKQEKSLAEAKKKAEELANGFKQVREAQKLLDGADNLDDIIAATDLLIQEQQKLGKIIDTNSKTQGSANQKATKEIKDLSTQLSFLVARQKELQAAGGKGLATNELAGQINGLKEKIVALRGASEATAQANNNFAGSIGQITSLAPPAIQRIGSLGSQITSLVGSYGLGVASATAFLGVTAGLTSAIISQTEVLAKNAKVADEIKKSTGASTEFIGALTNVIQSYGGEVQNVQELLLQVGSVINQAVAEPAGAAAEKFKKLETAFRDTSGRARTAEQVIKDFDKAAKAGALSTEKLAIVSTIFGEEASKQFLGRLGELNDLQKSLEKTGAIISNELIAKAQQFNKVGQTLQSQITGLSQSLSGELLDSLTDIKKVASQALESLDPDTINGFKAIIQDLGRTIFVLGETGVRGFSALAGAAGDLATGVSAILNPLDTLQFLFTGTPPLIDKTTASSQSLVKAFTAGAIAVEELTKKLAGLNLTQSLRLADAENAAQASLEAIEKLLKIGEISEQEAAQRRLEIQKKLLSEKDIAIEQERGSILNFIEDQRALREQDFAQRKQESDKFEADRKKKDEDFLKFKRDNEFRLQQLNTLTADTERELNDRNGEAQKTVLREKLAGLQAEQKAIQDGLNFRSANAKIAEATDRQTKANLAKAEEELSKFRRALALEEVVTEQQVGPQLFALRKVVIDNKIKLNKSFRDQNAADNKAELEQGQKLVDQKTKDLAKINDLEAQAISEQKALLQQGARDKQEVEQQITKIQVVNQQDRLTIAQKALADFKALAVQDAEIRKALEKEVADESGKLDDLKTKQKIDNIQRVIEAIKNEIATEDTLRQSYFDRRKNEISLLKDLNQQRVQQSRLEIEILDDGLRKAQNRVTLEQQQLEKLKANGATTGEIREQEAKVTAAIDASNIARDQAREKTKQIKQAQADLIKTTLSGEDAINARIAASVDRADSAVGKLKGGLTTIGESFDFASLSTEELNDKILQLEGNIKFIQQVAAIGDKDAYINPQLAIIDELNAEIVKRTQGAALAKAAEEQRIAEEKARETSEKLQDIAEKREEDILEIKKKRREDERDLDSDRASEAESFNNKLRELGEDLASDLKEIAERKAAEEKEIADRAIEEEEERQRKIAEIKKKASTEAATAANAIELGSLAEQLKLQEQINAEKDPKKQIELKNKLAESERKVDQASRKAAELAALEKEDLSEEEFNARKDAIEKKFKLEEDAAQERLKLAEVTDEKLRTEGLARLDQLIKEQQARNQKGLEDELKSIKEAAARKAKQAEEERAKKQADYEQQTKDRQSAFDKAKADEEKDHRDRVAALDARQKEIRAKYKETFNEINQSAIDSAKALGVTGQAIADAFALGNAELEKYINNLNKAKDAQAGLNPGGGSSSSPAGSSSSSPSSSPSPSSPSGSSPFGGTTPNSNAGSTGSIGSPTTPPPSPSGKGVVEQPKGDQSGKQPGGVSKPKSDPDKINSNGSTSTADGFRSAVIDLQKQFEKSSQNDKAKIKAGEQLYLATKSYIVTAIANDPSIKDKQTFAQDLIGYTASDLGFKIISTNLNSPKAAIRFADYFIGGVESRRKTGANKNPDKAADIGPKDTPIKTPGLSSDPQGSTKGDVGGQIPGGKEPPAPSRGNDLSDRDAAVIGGRNQDAENRGGGDEEAFQENQAIIGPDSAINRAARPKAPDAAPANQPNANTPVVNNNQTVAPVINNTININLPPGASTAGNIDFRGLEKGLKDRSNQEAQQAGRGIAEFVVAYIKRGSGQ